MPGQKPFNYWKPKSSYPSKFRPRYPRYKKKPEYKKQPTSYKVDPMRDALLRTPLFAIRKRQRSMLYYESGLSIDPPATGNASPPYIYSANGMFDPNVTSTGHQPLGFDQMMQLYDQYTVVNSSITVNFIFSDSPVRVAVMLSPDNTAFTNPAQIMENGLVKTMALTGLSSRNSNTNLRVPQLKLGCNVASYFGRKTLNELLDDTSLTGTVAANPLEQVYFEIYAWQLNSDGSDAGTVAFDILLDYDVIFWEPKKLIES